MQLFMVSPKNNCLLDSNSQQTTIVKEYKIDVELCIHNSPRVLHITSGRHKIAKFIYSF